MDRCDRYVSRRLLIGILAISAAGAVPEARAQDTQGAYSVNLGVGRSDNILRTPDNEIDETTGTAGVTFSLLRESRRLRADLIGDFAYYDYFDDTFDDEIVGTFDGEATLGIVPERFEWLFSDTFGQTTEQRFSVVTPENRENVNYFTTGPKVMLGAGSNFRVTLDGRYTKGTYEDSPLDNERRSGTIALIRSLSPSSAVSLNLHHAQIEFEDDENIDFDRSEAYARFNGGAGRTSFALDVGYTQLDRQNEESSGLLIRAEMTRRVSPSSIVSLTLGRESSDAGDIFEQLGSMETNGGRTLPVQPTSDPFTSKYATLGWHFERNRTSFGASLAAFDEEYEGGDALNRTRYIYSGFFARELTPVVQFRLSAEQEEEKDEQTDAKLSELYLTSTLSWRLGRRLSLELQYERFDGDGSGGIAADYTENRGWLRIGFGGGSVRSTNLAPVQTGTP